MSPSPPMSVGLAGRRRKASISPPARYKHDYYNDATETVSSSDECEMSEPYEGNYSKYHGKTCLPC